jgi:hypothetical protein
LLRHVDHILFLPLLGIFLTGILLSGSSLVYAFHEYLPQLDTEAKLKKYYKEHLKNDQDFKDKDTKESLKVIFTELACGVNAMSDSEYPGSTVIGNALENCDNKMAGVKAQCMLHNDIFSYCDDKTLKTYVDYRGIGGKAYDMMVAARSSGVPIFQTEADSQTQSENVLPETGTTNKYIGSMSLDSLKQQFSNKSK